MPIQVPWAVQNQRDQAAAAAAAHPAQPAQTPAGPPTPANVNGAGAAPGPQGDPTSLGGYLGNVGPNMGPTGMAPWQSWMASGGTKSSGEEYVPAGRTTPLLPASKTDGSGVGVTIVPLGGGGTT